MKKTVFIFLFSVLALAAFSQDNETSLKKEIVAVHIGLLGGWVSYERHLGGLFTLKGDVGMELGFGQDFISDVDTYVIFTPSIKIEPRYYYSFNRRVGLEKKTAYNASNYLALCATFIPSLFTISNVHGLEAEKSTVLALKWGIKRTVGQRFNFEFALGPGIYLSNTRAEGTAGLDLRFGYNIK